MGHRRIYNFNELGTLAAVAIIGYEPNEKPVFVFALSGEWSQIAVVVMCHKRGRILFHFGKIQK